MQLEGKKILITGAGSGIGQALAVELAAKGNEIVLAGRSLKKLHQTRDFIQTNNAFCCSVDIQSPAERSKLVETVEKELNGIDVIFNNAGIVTVGGLEEMSDEHIHQMVTTNLVAPIQLCKAFLPLLRQSSSPAIVNTGSMFGDIAYPLFAVYSATKFGLRGLSDALRRELAHEGIKVIYAAPRATKTTASSAFDNLIEPFDMALDHPEQVARHIIKSVERGATTIYPPTKERFFLYIQRLFPKLIDQTVTKQVLKVKSGNI